jgi:hypothetical protein
VHLRTGESEDADHLLYVAFDILYIDGAGAAEAFARAGIKPCKVKQRHPDSDAVIFIYSDELCAAGHHAAAK